MASPICVQCGHPKWAHDRSTGICDAMVLINPRQIVTAAGFIETEHDKVECGCLKFTAQPSTIIATTADATTADATTATTTS